MGWTVLDERPSGLTTEEFFEREFPGVLRGKIVASGTAPDSCGEGSVFYAAVREPEGADCNPAAKPGDVWAFVALTKRYGQRAYGYKEMTEDMGPGEYNCPASVLSALTPTDSEYALRWRERCRENLARQASKPRVKAGDRLRFSRPIEFANDESASELVATDTRRAHFRTEAGTIVRLPRSWKRQYEYEVLS